MTEGRFLETERLLLREFREDDLENLYLLDSDPEVMKYMTKIITDKEDVKTGIQNVLNNYKKYPGLGLWICERKEDKGFIGWFCLKKLEKTEEIEIGYRLMKFAWGKGYATEMSRELLRYGFENTGLNRIVGVTHPLNVESQNVLTKIGLKFEKMAVYWGVELKYYSLEKKDYKKL